MSLNFLSRSQLTAKQIRLCFLSRHLLLRNKFDFTFRQELFLLQNRFDFVSRQQHLPLDFAFFQDLLTAKQIRLLFCREHISLRTKFDFVFYQDHLPLRNRFDFAFQQINSALSSVENTSRCPRNSAFRETYPSSLPRCGTNASCELILIRQLMRLVFLALLWI